MNRKTVIIAVVSFILILLGIGLFNAIVQSIGGSSPKVTPKPTQTPAPISVLSILNSDDSQVRVSVVGSIVAKENHIDETTSISKSQRNIYYVRAYSGTAEPNISFDNNQPAFEDFARALNNFGFTKVAMVTSSDPKPADTEVGLCPNGQRYIFEIIRSGQSVYRAWSTSCGDPTTFGGDTSSIIRLFQSQIPNYRDIAAKSRP